MAAGSSVVYLGDRKPPHNIECEQALLGAILINNEAYFRVSGFLDADDFYDPIHGELFNTCGRLIREGRLARPLTLEPFFSGRSITDDLTVPQYCGRLAANAVTVINARDYGLTIREFASRRRLQSVGQSMVECAHDQTASLADVVAESVEGLDDVLAGQTEQRKTRRTIAEAADDALARLKSDDAETDITTGLKDLDRLLGCYHPGELVVVGGRPSMGKSALASSSLLRTAMAGHGVLFFSLEMTGEALAERCLSDLCWNRTTPIPYNEIRKRQVLPHDIERLEDARKRFADLPFVIDDKPGVTVAEIASRARQQVQRCSSDGKELAVVAVDHLGKIKPSSRYAGNKVAETGEAVAALAALAKDLNVVVLALCQLSRKLEGREVKDRRPTLADLRWSGDIEQDADVVMFVYRPAYYLAREKVDPSKEDYHEREVARQTRLEEVRNDLEIIVEKQRAGPCGTVKAFCEIGCNAVRDLR